MYFMWEEELYQENRLTLKNQDGGHFQDGRSSNNFLIHCCISSVFRLTALSYELCRVN